MAFKMMIPFVVRELCEIIEYVLELGSLGVPMNIRMPALGTREREKKGTAVIHWPGLNVRATIITAIEFGGRRSVTVESLEVRALVPKGYDEALAARGIEFSRNGEKITIKEVSLDRLQYKRSNMCAEWAFID